MKTEVKVKVKNSQQEHTEKFLPESPFTLDETDQELRGMVAQTVNNLNISEECTSESLDIIIITKSIIQ